MAPIVNGLTPIVRAIQPDALLALGLFLAKLIILPLAKLGKIVR